MSGDRGSFACGDLLRADVALMPNRLCTVNIVLHMVVKDKTETEKKKKNQNMTQKKKKKKTEHKEEGKFNDYFLKFIFKA